MPLADELCGAERARLVQPPLPPRRGLGDGKRDGIALGASPGHPLGVLDPGGEETLGSNGMLWVRGFCCIHLMCFSTGGLVAQGTPGWVWMFGVQTAPGRSVRSRWLHG